MRLHWFAKVGATLAPRKAFPGLELVDPALTRACLLKLQDEDVGYVRAALNGAFFTQDGIAHINPAESPNCPLCGMPDSVVHRHWECVCTLPLRQAIAADVFVQLEQSPDALRSRGWALLHPMHAKHPTGWLPLGSVSDRFRCLGGHLPVGSVDWAARPPH